MNQLADALKKAGLGVLNEPPVLFWHDGVELQGAVVVRHSSTRHSYEFTMRAGPETEAYIEKWVKHWGWAYGCTINRKYGKVFFYRGTSSD